MIEYKYYSCEEHIDFVIDDFINTYEVTPDIEFNNGENYCNYCDNLAKYILVYNN